MTLIIVFIQGLISFFSPCVFPLIPVYMSYLTGQKEANRKQILLYTFFFVLGISFTFFLLGLGFTALGQFFSKNQTLIARISGLIMIGFGLYQLGIFGRSNAIEQEHRFRFARKEMNVVSAFILGFTFSFAWTPCVGPTLTSVLLMTGTAKTMMAGLGLIGVYVLGFIIPFMVLGFFTSKVLDWIRSHRGIVKYTVKIGAVLMIVMGVMTLTGWMNSTTNYVSKPAEKPVEQETVVAPDFTLKDQYGKEHSLSDYKGKVIFLNFWATWCGPCKMELPHIQQVYEEYGYNKEDVVFLGVVSPGQENTSAEEIQAFIEENDLSYPSLFDLDGSIFYQYGVRSFPTTYMIDVDGNVYGAARGSLTIDMIRDIIEQTKQAE